MGNWQVFRPLEINLCNVADEELVRRVAERDEGALHELIRRHADSVYRVCCRICPDRSDAGSIVTEVFWELWRRAATFEASRGSIRTFLMLVARSRSIDHRRSEQSRERILLKFSAIMPADGMRLVDQSEPQDKPLRDEADSQIHAALNRLPNSQRIAIELAFFGGCTHEEISERLQTPLGTIKTRIRSGLLRMKQTLAKHHTHEGF